MEHRITERARAILRPGVVASVAAALGVAATAAFYIWALPDLVRDGISGALHSKLGVEMRATKVAASWSSFELNEVKIKLPAGNALSLESKKIAVRANLIGLSLGRLSAVYSVEVDGLKGHIVARNPALQPLVDKLLARSPGPERQAGSADHIRAALKNFSLEVDDAQGKLLYLSGSYMEYKDGEVLGKLERVAVGADPGSAMTLSEVGVRLRREDGRLKLRQANIGGVRLALAERPPAAASDSSGSKTESAETERLPDRLLGAVAWLGLKQAGIDGRADSATAGASAGTNSIFKIFSHNLLLNLKDASISKRDKKGERVILQTLRGLARGAGQGEFYLEGEGSARSGGAISCKMKVWPEELRAVGRLAFESLPLALIAPFLLEAPWYQPEQSYVDGELDLTAESIDRLAIKGRAHLRNAAVESPRIAPLPVRDIDVAMVGKGRWFPTKKRLEIADATVVVGNMPLSLNGASEWTSDHYLIDLKVKLPEMPCTQAVRAIPRDLLGDLEGFEWGGKISGEAAAKIDSRDLDKTELNIAVKDRCDFLRVPVSADLRRFRLPFIHQVIEPDGSLFEMETGPGSINWTYIEEISPFLPQAVMAHEDAGFMQHAGFSVMHIRDALVRDLKERRYAVGASTITMQLVKNLLLRREKTLARKVQEVLLTWWVEKVLEKRDIMELYLNVIEYGPKIYGIRNAARYYFNRTPAELSPAESIYLATILPNPKRYHVFFERRSLPPVWLDIMRAMLKRLGDKGWYTKEAMEYGLAELGNFRFYPDGEQVPLRQLPEATNPFGDTAAFDEGWEPPEDAGEESVYDEEETETPGPEAPAKTEPAHKTAEPGE